MAIVRGGRINKTIRGGVIREIVFSGTVEVDGLPASRVIKAYKINQEDRLFETESGVDGTWELVMTGNYNDEFRIICVGAVGENSAIYEHLSE